MSKKVDLYIIGPVTGKPADNREAFEKARQNLRACGYSVAIPHDFIPTGTEYWKAMWASVSFMLSGARAVAVMDGDLSLGSRMELNVCVDLHKPIDRVSNWIDKACNAPAAALRRYMEA